MKLLLVTTGQLIPLSPKAENRLLIGNEGSNGPNFLRIVGEEGIVANHCAIEELKLVVLDGKVLLNGVEAKKELKAPLKVDDVLSVGSINLVVKPDDYRLNDADMKVIAESQYKAMVRASKEGKTEGKAGPLVPDVAEEIDVTNLNHEEAKDHLTKMQEDNKVLRGKLIYLSNACNGLVQQHAMTRKAASQQIAAIAKERDHMKLVTNNVKKLSVDKISELMKERDIALAKAEAWEKRFGAMKENREQLMELYNKMRQNLIDLNKENQELADQNQSLTNLDDLIGGVGADKSLEKKLTKAKAEIETLKDKQNMFSTTNILLFFLIVGVIVASLAAPQFMTC